MISRLRRQGYADWHLLPCQAGSVLTRSSVVAAVARLRCTTFLGLQFQMDCVGLVIALS